MAQLTLTLDLTHETVNALHALVDALPAKRERIPYTNQYVEEKIGGMTPDPEQLTLNDALSQTPPAKPEKPAAKPKPPKTEKPVAEKPSEAPAEEAENEAPTEETPEVTLADVRTVATELSKKDREALQKILAKYDGPPLTKVPKEKLPAVLAEIREALNGK